jgi:carbamoyltransferase
MSWSCRVAIRGSVKHKIGHMLGLGGRRGMRVGPRHPLLGRLGFRVALPLWDRFFARRQIHRVDSGFARERIRAVRQKIEAGERVLLAGVSAVGMHNSGIALVEVRRETGPRLILNNEEERFTGTKHTMEYPRASIAVMLDALAEMGLTAADIDCWLSSWDSAALFSTLTRAMLEEFPIGLGMALHKQPIPVLDRKELDGGTRAARRIRHQLGLDAPLPLIATSHHNNHAWFSYAASPFARDRKPVLVAVLDGMGDRGAISIYLCEGSRMRALACNDSVFDSLGLFYAVISSTQGGWTWLSSEGRYMGATAYGNTDRATNPYYEALRPILHLGAGGTITLNRKLANWPRDVRKPYTAELIRILGHPIPYEEMWNPDAVLRVEDIKHKENTRERLDKAAATQMVFEDALMHVLAHWIKSTDCERLVLTGGIGLNALGNMRVLEHFLGDFFRRELGRDGRLHLWVPPVPNDAGVTIGAAYMGAHLAGYGLGEPIQHAFYCGLPPKSGEIRAAFAERSNVKRVELSPCRTAADRARYADFMAHITAKDAIFALYQGAAETGPRALGHRSILANPCNPKIRENLNAQVKYRELIRPLAPMMTLEAAQEFFELSSGAADDRYNAYNYMVLTAHAKPHARERIPAVIHADGTGRLQIVREDTDPLTYAYLKALGRRIGVEVAVNTSFNVAGPIAQTPLQALDTLRRSRGLDAVLMFAEDGPVFSALHGGASGEGGARFMAWLEDWQQETGEQLLAS